jgi:hypothetical protein
VTGPKISNDADIYSNLSRTIQRLGEETPCMGRDEIYEAPLDRAADVLEAIELCRTCPILAECRLAGRQLSSMARADSVMGGVRYNGNGDRVGVTNLRKADRGLVTVAELEGRVDAQADSEATAA